jgi:single-stranded-DNA-specific exonuclease
VLPRLELPPYDFAAAERLGRELGVSHVLAQVLVRRGHSEPDAARAFLDADECHPPAAFEGIEAAVATILRHLEAGSPIVVHGDYDVDGVCATAVLVRTLRRLDAVVSWFLPARVDDGYGLSAATVERLAAQGARLLVTVDCGITAVEEVARAGELGLDVVVTDHHTPRADGALPAAPIVHPGLCGYPCAELCGTAVAYKLAAALLESAGRGEATADDELELVGLATIADVVPLRGENRRLARAGLRALAGTPRPGLRALMRVARVDPSRLDAHAAAFRLAPRINAAGRLHRADAGVELVLTEDAARAERIAAELDAANVERRAVEERTLFDAERLVREANERCGAAPFSYVLANEGWRPGVIGIVASRIAERHHRPTVLVALDGEGGTGSGRSIPGFDLLGGLQAAGEHLERFGGHRAAAGLELRRERIDDLRAAFEAHARRVLEPADLLPVERVDAVVTGDALGLELAEELERLEPCGAGNPSPRLLVPAARCSDPRAMGEGRHVRFTLHAGGIRSRAVYFGSARLPVELDAPVDATFRLAVDEYRGMVEPRLVLSSVRSCEPAPIEVVGEPEDYIGAALAELDAPLDDDQAPGGGRRTLDRRGQGVAGVIADLVASGDGVLVVCADAGRRAGPLSERLGGFSLCSYDALDSDPSLAAHFRHVVLLDPPATPRPPALPGDGWIHEAWGPDELRFARLAHEHGWSLRDGVADVYRALRAGAPLAAALRGAAPHPRSAAHAGRLLRVLDELDLVTVDRERRTVAVPGASRTSLERSEAYRSYTRRYEQGLQWLGESTPRAA